MEIFWKSTSPKSKSVIIDQVTGSPKLRNYVIFYKSENHGKIQITGDMTYL